MQAATRLQIWISINPFPALFLAPAPKGVSVYWDFSRNFSNVPIGYRPSWQEIMAMHASLPRRRIRSCRVHIPGLSSMSCNHISRVHSLSYIRTNCGGFGKIEAVVVRGWGESDPCSINGSGLHGAVLLLLRSARGNASGRGKRLYEG